MRGDLGEIERGKPIHFAKTDLAVSPVGDTNQPKMPRYDIWTPEEESALLDHAESGKDLSAFAFMDRKRTSGALKSRLVKVIDNHPQPYLFPVTVSAWGSPHACHLASLLYWTLIEAKPLEDFVPEGKVTQEEMLKQLRDYARAHPDSPPEFLEKYGGEMAPPSAGAGAGAGAVKKAKPAAALDMDALVERLAAALRPPPAPTAAVTSADIYRRQLELLEQFGDLRDFVADQLSVIREEIAAANGSHDAPEK